MTFFRTLVLACLTATLWSQEADSTALRGLDVRVDIQSASVLLRTARNLSKASDAVKAQVDKLAVETAEFIAKGNTGEARRRIAHGYTLLGGKEWTANHEFAAALLLRSDTRIMDAGRHLIGRLEQVYPAAYQPTAGLRLHVSLHDAEAAPLGPRPGKLVKDFGVMEGVSRDLIDEPFTFEADLTGCGEGRKVLTAELMDGGSSIRRLWIAIDVVPGLDSNRLEIERRLSKLTGHESTKATILAPLDQARLINLGRREVARVDFRDEIRRSNELLTALEGGRDPLVRAVGNHKRHYDFTEAGEIMPYRVFAPKIYKPGARLPLVLALHGLGGNEDTFLGRDGGILQKLAEQHGFVVAAPLGYRVNGGYGYSIRRFTDAARRRMAELSEKDVLNVLRLVSEEYGTDPDRTYLMGHSMGGFGTCYLGAKYAEKWAAMAPIAGAMSEGYPFDRLKGMPVMISHGDADATVPVQASRAMVARMKELGLSPIYLEVAGASHSSVVGVAMPQIFDFFEQHSRKK